MNSVIQVSTTEIKSIIDKGIPFFVLFDKPRDIGSLDSIKEFKKKFSIKKNTKIGHLGTLDPFASGLLVVGLNGASRLMELCLKHNEKTYFAEGILGIKTTTGDRTGDILTCEGKNLSKEEVELAMLKTSGEITQRAHQYSAQKFEGKPLYQYARSKDEDQREVLGDHLLLEKLAHKREIKKVSLVEFSAIKDRPLCFLCSFKITVSAGTYIRTWFEDLATSLGTCGHLQELRRIAVGQNKLEDQIASDKNSETFFVTRPCDYLDFPHLLLDKETFQRLRQGQRIRMTKNGPLSIDSVEVKLKSNQHYWVFCQTPEVESQGVSSWMALKYLLCEVRASETISLEEGLVLHPVINFFPL